MHGTGYKLTDSNNQTHNRTQWGEGVTRTASGKGPLCSSGWIHFYDDLNLAVLFNPIHANFKNPNCWKIEWYGETLNDRGVKRGATSVTTLTKVELPEFTTNQKVAFAILCAKYVSKNKKWRKWADTWLSGKDRSYAAAAYAAANAATDAANAATDAAYAAANAAAYAANAAYAAAYAANAAYAAANAAYAANAAANAAPPPLKSLAKKALTYS